MLPSANGIETIPDSSAVAKTGLPQDRDREEDAHECGEVDQSQDRAAGECRVREQVRWNQRAVTPLGHDNLPRAEERDQRHACEQRQICPHRPALVLSLDEWNEDCDEAAGEEQEPEEVDAA